MGEGQTVNDQEQNQIYQLRIDLKHIQPPIWRRVLVPASATLADLHDIIQAVMPWWDAHLHEFECNGVNYGIPHRQEAWYPIEDSAAVTLGEVLPRVNAQINYTYDFGDEWQHKIRLEKVLEPAPELTYPICIKGSRAAPPEDCGGPHGYTHMLQVLQDPKHPDYDMYSEWLEDEIDPEFFDLEEANEALGMVAGDEEEFPGNLQPIPRMAIVLKPLKPMHKWVRSLPEHRRVTWQEVQQAGVVILVPFFEGQNEFEAYMVENIADWISTLFSVWAEDSDLWPQEVFSPDAELGKWFDMDLHPLVFDAALGDAIDDFMNSGLGQVFSSMLDEMDEDELGRTLGLN